MLFLFVWNSLRNSRLVECRSRARNLIDINNSKIGIVAKYIEKKRGKTRGREDDFYAGSRGANHRKTGPRRWIIDPGWASRRSFSLSRGPHLYLTLASLDIRLSSVARPLLLALQRRCPRSHLMSRPGLFSSFEASLASFLFVLPRRRGREVSVPRYYHR